MKSMLHVRQLSWALWTSLALAVAYVPAVDAKDPPPEVSPDGLHLQKSSKNRLVYLRPGATFSQYDKVAILDCYVEFEKDWQKDYNDSQRGFEGRVTDDDVARMKSGLAAEFKKVFTRELQDKGGYQVVDTAAPDVLVLRPALINVEVNAPDLMTAGLSATVVRSAGQMTLYLELWDASTNTILARVMDAEADNTQIAQPANRVTNTAAADRILETWAHDLRKHLDAVRGKAD
jgi:hypothetical protein